MDIKNYVDLFVSFRVASALYANSGFNLDLCPAESYDPSNHRHYSFCGFITLPGIPTESGKAGRQHVILSAEGKGNIEFERLASFGGQFLPLAVKDILRPCKPTTPLGWWIAFLFWNFELLDGDLDHFTYAPTPILLFNLPFSQSQDAIEGCDLTKPVGKLPRGLRSRYPGFTFEIEANGNANTDADTGNFYVTTSQLNSLIITPNLRSLKRKYGAATFNPIKGENGQADTYQYQKVRSIIVGLRPNLKERLPESVSEARKMIRRLES